MINKKVKALVLRTAGTNCENETLLALNLAGADATLAHINELIKKKVLLNKFQIIVVPGGFAYGDDLGAGRILANEIRFRLKKEFDDYNESGNLLVGICNGFQALIKTGFLPGNCAATLTNNDSGHFEDRWVWLKTARDSLFTKGIASLYLPVNHGEGKFVAERKDLDMLRSNGQIALRYVDENGNPGGYPDNPNGSADGIAAVTNREGNVFGMMPHPEKYVNRYQHPRWTREKLPEEGAGLKIFRNMVNYAEGELL